VLTKETAIAQLRTTGTLATEQRAAITVATELTGSPMICDVNRLMMGNACVAGLRHVAPSSNQVVLP
jgi:hypothetical protein